MKFIPFYLLLIFTTAVFAQDNDQEAAKQTIMTFFDGFHKQDSTIIKSVARDDMTLRSISPDKTGTPKLSEPTTLRDFMASIISIPKTTQFEERILGYQVVVDGAMALVWTPYELYFNGEFAHCGVNNFTLFKNDDSWEVVAIVDTRRREGCEK